MICVNSPRRRVSIGDMHGLAEALGWATLDNPKRSDPDNQDAVCETCSEVATKIAAKLTGPDGGRVLEMVRAHNLKSKNTARG